MLRVLQMIVLILLIQLNLFTINAQSLNSFQKNQNEYNRENMIHWLKEDIFQPKFISKIELLNYLETMTIDDANDLFGQERADLFYLINKLYIEDKNLNAFQNLFDNVNNFYTVTKSDFYNWFQVYYFLNYVDLNYFRNHKINTNSNKVYSGTICTIKGKVRRSIKYGAPNFGMIKSKLNKDQKYYCYNLELPKYILFYNQEVEVDNILKVNELGFSGIFEDGEKYLNKNITVKCTLEGSTTASQCNDVLIWTIYEIYIN